MTIGRIWSGLAVLALASAVSLPAAASPLTYVISPKSTDIDFAVGILGLTTCEGAFSRFTGSLTIDLERPERSAVSVQVDTHSAAMNWEQSGAMATSESYLDADHFPELRFVSKQVTVLESGKVRLDGDLTLHGVTHSESFEAELAERRWDGDHNGEEAAFAAIGTVKRSDYGMDSDLSVLDDKVTFKIRARVILSPTELVSNAHRP